MNSLTQLTYDQVLNIVDCWDPAITTTSLLLRMMLMMLMMTHKESL